MNIGKNIVVSVVGPTAVGKTAFAIELAENYGTEIISVDSRQFYREMEIGTAKPTVDELSRVPHYFINTHSINEYYNVGQYEQQVNELLMKLFQSHQVVVAVGGSGLFFKALWDGLDEMPEVDLDLRTSLNDQFSKLGLSGMLEELAEQDPEYYNQVDHNNHQRVIRALEVIRKTGRPFSSFRKGIKAEKGYQHVKIGLEMDREELYVRINKRMDMMIADGLFEEAVHLLPYRSHNALQTVGYSEIFRYLDGNYDREEAIRLLKRNSRRYAKRQLTWFKRDSDINWMHPNNILEAQEIIDRQLLL